MTSDSRQTRDRLAENDFNKNINKRNILIAVTLIVQFDSLCFLISHLKRYAIIHNNIFILIIVNLQ